MVAGHLREKNGTFQIVLSFNDALGNRKTKSISTGLPIKGNKKRAEALLMEARQNFDNGVSGDSKNNPKNILFTEFMLEWLELMKNSVEITTYANYAMVIKSRINPYFKDKGLTLSELTPKHIQDYYLYSLNVEKVSANTVIHRHANIRKALQYALKLGLIDFNPADRVERPKKNKYVATTYNEKELENLFSVVKGKRIEFAVTLGAFYGLRRSEIVGIKWDAIDFERKTFTIKHTVTEVMLDGKVTMIDKERTKTKSSYRTLPLVKPFEELLLRMKAEQETSRRVCGSAYCRKYLDYIYVNELGELVRPNFITQNFAIVLANNKLKKIRFHDLRHPYVKPTTKIFSLRLMDFQAQAYNSFERLPPSMPISISSIVCSGSFLFLEKSFPGTFTHASKFAAVFFIAWNNADRTRSGYDFLFTWKASLKNVIIFKAKPSIFIDLSSVFLRNIVFICPPALK